ncbi:hypothetical protein, partial [Staphylococcus capitis]|uniref:hypothetical protein n=1 Tax=Staphylococcus capitis TaxID=29388 RepID=UPI001C92C36E
MEKLFKQFNEFWGMRGRGKVGEKELLDLYWKIVVEMGSNSGIKGEDGGDRVFGNGNIKNEG